MIANSTPSNASHGPIPEKGGLYPSFGLSPKCKGSQLKCNGIVLCNARPDGRQSAESVEMDLANSFPVEQKGWMVIPFGEYAHPSGLTQILDAQSAGEIVRDFANALAADPHWPGVPVTKGHPGCEGFAESDDSAYGWIKTAKIEHASLMLKPEYNEPGAALVANKQFVYFSPVWAVRLKGNRRATPCRVSAVGLTNRPVIRVRPLANAKPNGGKRKMNELLKLLGLAEDATEEQAAEAASQMLSRIAELESKVVEQAAALTNAEGEKESLANAKTALEGKVQEGDTTLANARKQHAQLLLDVAAFDGRVPPGARHAWEREFDADYNGTITKLANAKPVMQTASRTATQAERGKESSSLRDQIIELVNAEKSKGATHDIAFARVRKQRPELFAS